MNINFDVDNLINIIYNGVIELCEKFGFAIDWTQENILPYVLDVLNRYRIMEIVSLGIDFCIYIICWFTFGKLIYNRNLPNKNLTDYEGPTLRGVFAIVLGIVSVLFFFLFLRDIGTFLRWIFVPELQYYDIISSLIK